MFEIAPLSGVGSVDLGLGLAAALAAGLAGSLHCAAMCGPLAAVAHRARGGWHGAAAWHGGRLLAYAGVGAMLGSFGGGLARTLSADAHRVLPWVMVLGLVLSAFELGRGAVVPVVGSLLTRVTRIGARLGPWARGGLLGLATPLLPCGLLWGVFLAAAGAGTAVSGAALMLLFGAGSTPSLAAVQLGADWVGRYPRAQWWLRRAVPLVAAAVIVVRTLTIDPHLGGTCH